jgi:hypothetical protein
MRGCAPVAIAILALEACAPGSSAKRGASYLADLPDYYTTCTTTSRLLKKGMACVAVA